MIGWIIAIAVGALFFVFKLRTLGIRGGDLFRVAIPKSASTPLAMGTRLEVMAELQKRGVATDELRRLGDGSHDQALLDRYWASAPTAATVAE